MIAQRLAEGQPIQAGQPFDAPPERGLLMACGRLNPHPDYVNTITRSAPNGPEPAEGLMACGRLNSPPDCANMFAEARRIAPSLSRGMPVVYFLRLRTGMLYVGASTDLEQRLADHMSGQACRTTALDPPMSVLRVEVHNSLANARAREAQLKKWSRAKKDALISGDIETLKSLSLSRD